VWFAPLAPVPDPVAVPEAVAAAVGARDEGAGAEAKTAPEDRVADRLGGRAALLVLDNCEHVAAAATSFVAGLLARCPRVVVLATSREPLGISGELQKHVDPLAVADAVTLFADRARAVQERFVVTDEDELAMLCRRLDGLPLAIELAAARTRVLPVAELAARVDDRFRLLTGAGTGDPRHRALVAAIDASYDLLFDDERRAFRRLSVFAGGVPLSVATEVCGPDALDLVTRLVDRSLLVADLSGREARYRMLESLRAYGRDRLVDEGELDDAMRALVSWSRDVAHQAAVAVRSAGQLDHLARLDVEHDNLRAALAWAVTGAPDDGLALVGWLLVPWFVHGRPQEARHWAEACLAAAVDPRPDDLARVLAYVGLIAEAPGWTGQPGAIEEQLATAEGRQRRAIGLADELGDDLLRADAQLVLLATLARRASMGMAVDRDQVVPIVRDAVAAFEAHDDQYGAGCVRSTEAIFGIVDGDEAAVALAIERTRAHVARSGDRFGASRVEWLLGIQARAAGDPALAYRHVERSIRLLDELGMAHAVTSQAEVLAQLAQAAGEDALAAQWRAFVRARRGGTTLLDSSIAAASRNRAGLAARSAGSPDEARTAHLEALALYEEAGSASGIAFTQSCLGFLDGDQTRHQQALTAAVDAGDPVALALALLGIASGFGPGEEAWAAVLLGAAAARWPSAGPPSHREDLDAVRAALGDGWAVEEAVGSVLSSDELLATVRLRRLVRA
jgi:predicted ATPase